MIDTHLASPGGRGEASPVGVGTTETCAAPHSSPAFAMCTAVLCAGTGFQKEHTGAKRDDLVTCSIRGGVVTHRFHTHRPPPRPRQGGVAVLKLQPLKETAVVRAEQWGLGLPR